jgi:hypothetical protein
LNFNFIKNPKTRLVCQKSNTRHTGKHTAAETLIAEEPETLMFGEVRSWEERESRERNVCVACVCAHWVLFVEELASSAPLHDDDDDDE